MKYYSRTTYQVVQDDMREFDTDDENTFDTKEEALEYVQEIIDDGDFDETHIVINEINENNYASCDDQYTEKEVFECRAFYDGDEIKLDISNNEIGYIETPKGFNSWLDLMKYTQEHKENCEYILDYDFFSVVKIGDKYFYYTAGKDEVDDEEFAEVEIVARLDYDVNHCLLGNDEDMVNLFNHICCGEYVYDNGISYIWFDEVKGE